MINIPKRKKLSVDGNKSSVRVGMKTEKKKGKKSSQTITVRTKSQRNQIESFKHEFLTRLAAVIDEIVFKKTIILRTGLRGFRTIRIGITENGWRGGVNIRIL